MALRPSDKENFATLERAWKAGRVAIMESRDVATGEYRALLCAMGGQIDSNGNQTTFEPVPLAVMVWNNPYESFADPTADTLPPAVEPLSPDGVAVRHPDTTREAKLLKALRAIVACGEGDLEKYCAVVDGIAMAAVAEYEASLPA